MHLWIKICRKGKATVRCDVCFSHSGHSTSNPNMTLCQVRDRQPASRERLVAGASGCLTMTCVDIVFTSATALLVNQPHCLQCGRPMRLVCLTPLVPHMMQRTFECSTCDHARDETTLSS